MNLVDNNESGKVIKRLILHHRQIALPSIIILQIKRKR